MSSTKAHDKAASFSGRNRDESTQRAASSRHPPYYPFAATAGMEAAKRALMLLAVDAGLRGVLITSAEWSETTAFVRSFAAMLAQLDSLSLTPEDNSSRPNGEAKAVFPLIDLPLNVTVDRLLGGIDLDRTVATGTRHHAPGLLAEADGGLLLVADINLLDANLTDHVAAALDAGAVRVEREGLSATLHSRFRLIGAYNRAGGEVSPHLKDRVGILIECAPEYSPEGIAEAVSRALRFDQDPCGFIEEFAVETAAVQSAIADARERLGEITMTSSDIRRVAEAAISLGVEGNRADLFAVKAARANAAISGRDRISDEDIITAIKLVLLPRATRFPAPEEGKEGTGEPSASANEESGRDDRVDSDNHRDSENRVDSGDAADDDFIERTGRPIEELVVEAMDAPAPDDALTQWRSKPGRGNSGRRSQVLDHTRGRYVASDSRRNKDARLAIDATLRAAAPYQAARRVKKADPSSPGVKDKKLRITAGDLRFKRFKRKAGTLFIFAVDASGSMALNRMAQAKGALARLLQQAYLHRDKVALISFRRSTAETILAPTRSVELAKRIVDALPTGGATPIAAAIVEALGLARLARLQGISQAMLLLFTDGRANVALHSEGRKGPSQRAESITDELKRIGGVLEAEGIAAVVIDTRPRFVSTGEGRALAELIGGRYLYLPRADTTAIYNAVASVSEEVRRQT
jgi:magnesium chelatase subunit D